MLKMGLMALRRSCLFLSVIPAVSIITGKKLDTG
jgi:hypothetical protein